MGRRSGSITRVIRGDGLAKWPISWQRGVYGHLAGGGLSRNGSAVPFVMDRDRNTGTTLANTG